MPKAARTECYCTICNGIPVSIRTYRRHLRNEFEDSLIAAETGPEIFIGADDTEIDIDHEREIVNNSGSSSSSGEDEAINTTEDVGFDDEFDYENSDSDSETYANPINITIDSSSYLNDADFTQKQKSYLAKLQDPTFQYLSKQLANKDIGDSFSNSSFISVLNEAKKFYAPDDLRKDITMAGLREEMGLSTNITAKVNALFYNSHLIRVLIPVDFIARKVHQGCVKFAPVNYTKRLENHMLKLTTFLFYIGSETCLTILIIPI